MSAKKTKTPTAKERVLAVFPMAHLMHESAAHYAIIFMTGDPNDSRIIAEGRTTRQAWTSAARNLEKTK